VRTSQRGIQILAVMAVVLFGTVGWTGTSVAATPGVPYTDPDAVGYIGLCNQAGQQITSGSITDTPFAWRAVSSQAAPAAYRGSTRTATLAAYLPMQALPPGDWSGQQLTASSRYSNPASPMAAATASDQPLQSFIEAFPPELDGFIQLRLYLGAANQPAYTAHYPTLDIQVTGATWNAVGGGPVNCNAGTSESIETILSPGNTAVPAKGTTGPSSAGADGSAAVSRTSSGGSSGSGGSGGSASKGSAAGTHPATGSPAPNTTATSTTSHTPLIAGIVIAGVAVLVTLGLLISRRRRGPDPTPEDVATNS
jgi:hypothetical protein